MKLKKLAKCSLATALILGSVGAISGCNKDNDTTEKTEQEETYNLYVQYMSAKGETPLTYEQWLASIKGEKGQDGISPKVRINETTNYWEISTDNGVTWTSTGVKATGNPGSNGNNGHTPVITVGQNGNWFVDGVDTNVKAQGDKGNDAIAPQVRINQTTNYWEISTDNGVTWTSTGVKATGAEGEKGDPGDDAIAPQVRINQSTNYWEISTDNGVTWTSTGVKATGAEGEKGDPGDDAIAPQVRINQSTNYWEISTDNGVTWTSTGVKATGAEGEKGDPGDDASFAVYKINYDYGAAKDFFDNNVDNITVKSTEWINNMPKIKEEYKDSFLGWFIEDTDKQIENYDFIGANITLEARFNREKLGLSGLYQKGKYAMSWQELKDTYGGIGNNNIYPIPISAESYYKSHFKDAVGELVIDKSITTISAHAFEGCLGLTNIIMPEGVVSIGERAFAFSGITSLVIPSTVTTIGVDTFGGWTIVGETESLTKIEVAEGNTVYDSRDNSNAIIETATNTLIIGCQNTIIPSTVTKIGDYAFHDCDSLTNIIIPEGVTQIGIEAFENCDNLTTIVIPESVTHILGDAFFVCFSLKEVYINSSNVANGLIKDPSYEINISEAGALISYADTVYIKTGLNTEESTYLTDNFTKQATSDKAGYDMYVRNAE